MLLSEFNNSKYYWPIAPLLPQKYAYDGNTIIIINVLLMTLKWA